MFGRETGSPTSQFIPGDGYELQPLGDADEQVKEAMALAKKRNRQPEVGMAERIAKMDGMNVATATDFLDGLNQHERENYLTAEKMSKRRSTVLGRYGWS